MDTAKPEMLAQGGGQTAVPTGLQKTMMWLQLGQQVGQTRNALFGR
jgi:hypothetical protein